MLLCGEICVKEDNKSIEHWIQCDVCHQWCHEDCSALKSTEAYICDNCQLIIKVNS